jgi:hypothetical protein
MQQCMARREVNSYPACTRLKCLGAHRRRNPTRVALLPVSSWAAGFRLHQFLTARGRRAQHRPIDTLWRGPCSAQRRRMAKRVRGVRAKSWTRLVPANPGGVKTQGSIQRARR